MDEFGLVQFIVLGTLLFFILISLFIAFLFLHRKKMVEKEVNFQKLKVKQQKELLHNEINAIEKERSRIAKDLHDEVGAMLSLIRMNISQMPKFYNEEVKVVESVENTTELVDQTISDVRRISRDLMPSILQNYGYIEAVKEICNSWSSDSIRFISKINSDLRLPQQSELQLYRVTQEFVNNAIKHAECNQIEIGVDSNENLLLVHLSDNGKGFDYNESYKKNSLGLKTIESRLGLVKAKYSFHSSPGDGTKLNIEIPIN